MTAVDRPDNGQDEGDARELVAQALAASINAIRQFRAEQQRADDEDCGHHSWAGLMSLLDEHWPDDIFPTREDDITRDAGARIVSLLRWVDRLGGPQPDVDPGPQCPSTSHDTDGGWRCAVEGPHDERRNAAGDVTW